MVLQTKKDLFRDRPPERKKNPEFATKRVSKNTLNVNRTQLIHWGVMVSVGRAFFSWLIWASDLRRYTGTTSPGFRDKREGCLPGTSARAEALTWF